MDLCCAKTDVCGHGQGGWYYKMFAYVFALDTKVTRFRKRSCMWYNSSYIVRSHGEGLDFFLTIHQPEPPPDKDLVTLYPTSLALFIVVPWHSRHFDSKQDKHVEFLTLMMPRFDLVVLVPGLWYPACSLTDMAYCETEWNGTFLLPKSYPNISAVQS